MVRVRLNQKQHPGYFSAQDAAPRQAANRKLRRLADAGALRLRWARWEENNWLKSVDLNLGHAAELYALLQRTPRNVQHAALKQLLDRQRPGAPWHRSFLDWAQGQLAGGRSLAPLRLDDAAWNADVLRALQALTELGEPTLERSFSVRVFGNSKRFAALESAVLRVLRQHDPAAAAYGKDNAATLRAHFLDRVPEYVPLAGPLRLLSAGAELDLAHIPAKPGPFGGHAAGGGGAGVRGRQADHGGKQHQLQRAEPAPAQILTAIIYTGGFASPTVIQLCGNCTGRDRICPSSTGATWMPAACGFWPICAARSARLRPGKWISPALKTPAITPSRSAAATAKPSNSSERGPNSATAFR